MILALVCLLGKKQKDEFKTHFISVLAWNHHFHGIYKMASEVRIDELNAGGNNKANLPELLPFHTYPNSFIF
jgi:hypothetical protein